MKGSFVASKSRTTRSGAASYASRNSVTDKSVIADPSWTTLLSPDADKPPNSNRIGVDFPATRAQLRRFARNFPSNTAIIGLPRNTSWSIRSSAQRGELIRNSSSAPTSGGGAANRARALARASVFRRGTPSSSSRQT